MDSFFDWSQPVDVTERSLPHWSQKRVVYFATFRLADAIPKPILTQWIERKEAWLAAHPEPREVDVQGEYHRLFTWRFHDYLDAGHAECLLANAGNSRIVADALKHFDAERYKLGEWGIMPNHVPVVFQSLDDWVPRKILHSWKSFTASKINQAVEREGQFWQHESYDRIVRSASECSRIDGYIRKNPAKAGVSVHQASWIA